MVERLSPDIVHARSGRLQPKIISALAACERALKRSKRPYIAFSGGKDSLVVLGLLTQFLQSDITFAWSDDELEYPEHVQFLTDIKRMAGDQMMVTLGWATHNHWFQPWVDKPYWREPFAGSIAVDCDQDEWMAGLGYDMTFLGLRMDENRRRRNWLVQTGPIYHSTTGTLNRCSPIWDWTADDVWGALALWGLPHSPVYDRLTKIRVPRDKQRVGPLPLARRAHLEEGWPDLLVAMERRYGPHWPD